GTARRRAANGRPVEAARAVGARAAVAADGRGRAPVAGRGERHAARRGEHGKSKERRSDAGDEQSPGSTPAARSRKEWSLGARPRRHHEGGATAGRPGKARSIGRAETRSERGSEWRPAQPRATATQTVDRRPEERDG